MSEPLGVDIFVEDRAHEAFLRPLVLRLAREAGNLVSLRIRAARGGHPRALEELANYQRVIEKHGLPPPDVLVIGVDANCSPFARARKAVEQRLGPELRNRAVIACPDPHIERWYLADPDSFRQVVGSRPHVRRRKCGRALYKTVLANAVAAAGHPRTLGGIEFAREIVEAMDLYRAGKAQKSLKHFVDGMRAQLRPRG